VTLIIQIAAGILLALFVWNFFWWVLGATVVIWIMAVIYNNVGPIIARRMTRAAIVQAPPPPPEPSPLPSHLSPRDRELRRRIEAGEDISKVLDDAQS
jgi:hypothetical protein